MSRAVEHHVNKNGRQFVTFTNHLGHIGAKHCEHFGGFFGNNVSGRSNQPGVWHQARHVSGSPLHNVASSSPMIHVNASIPVEYNVKPLDRPLLCGQYHSRIEMTQCTVSSDPCDLVLRHRCKRSMRGQTFHKRWIAQRESSLPVDGFAQNVRSRRLLCKAAADTIADGEFACVATTVSSSYPDRYPRAKLATAVWTGGTSFPNTPKYRRLKSTI